MERFRELAPNADPLYLSQCLTNWCFPGEHLIVLFKSSAQSRHGLLFHYCLESLRFASITSGTFLCQHLPMVDENILIMFVTHCATSLGLS